MPRYSAEFKEQAVRKLMPPNNRAVASVSQKIGISEASLYNWTKQFRAQGYVVPKKSTIADHWDAKAGPVTKAVLAKQRKKYKQLEKELQRKEKALAEAAALLALSKKAQAIWGTDEED